MNWLAMLTTPLLVLWMMAGSVEGQADGNFWWQKGTTNAPPEAATTSPSGQQQPPCVCVKYYVCVNGTISTSGAGLIDIRFGGGHQRRPPPRNRDASTITQCPDLYDVCCAPPLPPTTTVTTTTTTPQPTLPPDTPCKCVSFINCTAERLVSDGGGNTSLENAVGFIPSHSACPHALTVCCALEPMTTTPVSALTTTSGLALTTTPAPALTTPIPMQSHCDCVEPFLCDVTGTIIISGGGLMDLRTAFKNPNPSIVCEDSTKICCNKPPPEFESSSSSSTSSIMTSSTPSPPPSTTPMPPTTPNCGSRNQMGIAARILGFQAGESQFGEFPWVATVLRKEFILGKPALLFVGGGTLIHPRVVITAAHKLSRTRPNQMWVRLGEWDTQTEYEAYAHQNVQVEEIVIHPDFEPRTLYNDIALLFLKEEVTKAPHISHICITDDLLKVDGSACIINGWGKNGYEDSGEYQKIMKSLTLPLVDHGLCQTQLRSTRLGPYFRLHPSFLCAGGEKGKDACTGDGGGPLACPRLDDPTRYLLVGITAWGIGCGQDGLPGVYASVPANYDWIKNEIYSRYPPPTTTTKASTTLLSTTTTTTTTTGYEEEEEEEFDYGEWEYKNTKTMSEKERKRKEKKQRKREEKRRRREERRRRRQEKKLTAAY